MPNPQQNQNRRPVAGGKKCLKVCVGVPLSVKRDARCYSFSLRPISHGWGAIVHSRGRQRGRDSDGDEASISLAEIADRVRSG